MTPRRVERRTFEILIPLTDDASGVMHPQALFDDWQAETAQRFGGLTWLGVVEGAWFDPGRAVIVRDKSHGFLLGVEEDREPELLTHASRAAARFGQKCIFLERRGTAFFVYPERVAYTLSSAAELPIVSDHQIVYAPRLQAGIPPNDAAHLDLVRGRIAAGDDYLAVLDLAVGRASPLLRGASHATDTVQTLPAYLEARRIVTEYGRQLGLVGADPSVGPPGVREPTAEYGAPAPACVSQYRAATLLGWPLADVRLAMEDGRLRARTIDGARVIEERSVREALAR
jgi:hypothetical protein